jgi:hypothetical protein
MKLSNSRPERFRSRLVHRTEFRFYQIIRSLQAFT